jgi:isopentenyldiphosphate isomerase
MTNGRHIVVTDSTVRPGNSPEEWVEEIDRDGTVLRLVSRREMRTDRLRHRSVFVAVVSSRGELLVHRRSMSKDIWPGWWDIAVGGAVAPGESFDSAARRELSEEVGIDGLQIDFIGSGSYEDSDVKLMAHCYVCRSDGPFVFSDGEVTHVEWVPAAELHTWLTTHSVLPDSVALVLPRILAEGLLESGLGFLP